MGSASYALIRPSFVALSVIALVGGAVSVAGAQQVGGTWRVQPSAGVWLGPGTADSRLGRFAGLEVSRQRGARTRLTASTGYYRIGDARVVNTFGQGLPRTEVYDYELIPVSAGVAYDVWKSGGSSRPAAVSLGFEGGAVWSRNHFVRSTGLEPMGGAPGPGEFSPVFLAAPSLAVRRAMTRQLEATAGARAVVGILEGVEAYPAFSAGLAWRM